VQSWFQQELLATEVVHSLIDQLETLDFRGSLCLQHFNEPLLDPRIAELGRYARGKRRFSSVFICTNGDLIDQRRASELDGAFDALVVTFYANPSEASARAGRLVSLFRETQIVFNTIHLVTHYSPDPRLSALVQEARALPCVQGCRFRMVVNHRGDMLLCCDDLVGHFDLGNVRDRTLEELWYNEKHQQMLLDLERPGGRSAYRHCSICPRRD